MQLIRTRSSTIRWLQGITGKEKDVLGAIVGLVFGGSVGWLASLITRSGTQQGIVLNILAGILGALAGRLFLKKLMDESVMFTSMIASLAGAIIVTGIVNLVWRRALR